jgi:hypothetical protein
MPDEGNNASLPPLRRLPHRAFQDGLRERGHTLDGFADWLRINRMRVRRWAWGEEDRPLWLTALFDAWARVRLLSAALRSAIRKGEAAGVDMTEERRALGEDHG